MKEIGEATTLIRSVRLLDAARHNAVLLIEFTLPVKTRFLL
jgi:hypothetical protein